MDLFGNTFKHSLFIIGNGFDLAHSMETSWGDFYKWLKTTKHFNLINFLEANVGMKTDLWKDFEKALGEYSINDIYDQCTEFIEIDYDHMMRSAFAIEDSPDIELLPRKEELVRCFSKWVEGLWISNEPLSIEIPTDARYLTFNYTETLEKLYGIPTENILHIHGTRFNPIFGHGNYCGSYDNESDTEYQIAAKEKIIGVMNDLHKDVNGIIAEHKEYFESLYDVDQIIVRGISYGEIDYPYFVRINEVVSEDCTWELGWHTENDKNTASSIANTLGIKSELFCF